MLTKEQKLLLAQLVRDNKDVLLKKFGQPGVTKKKKELVWESIRRDLIDCGADLPNLKTLRDTEWNNLRRAALKRYLESQKTGASLSTIDEIIMDSIGRDCLQARGEESDSAEWDVSQYLTVECKADEVSETIDPNPSSSKSNMPAQSTSQSSSSHHPTAASGAANLKSDLSVAAPVKTRGDQIVPPSRLMQQLGLLKRKRKLEENEMAMAAALASEEDFGPHQNGFDYDLQGPEEVDFERIHLEKELLRQEIQLRKVQILETKARTSYYQAATQAILHKKTPPSALEPIQ